mmetsp:Transcript_43783/g.76869  ORF Transcript_43783/g.76869 Transcript_43783/m.76869 type:complete len:780 (-) Transcript_43783:56-2395(-)
MVSVTQHLRIENDRLNIIHKLLFAAFLGLIVARLIVLKLWQREFDISKDVFFNLDTSGADTNDALNIEWSDMLSSSFCNASAMYNYHWLHPDEDARGRFKFTDIECLSPCLPGRYDPFPCFPSWDLVQRPTPATVLLVTSRRSTNYSIAGRIDSLHWVAGAKSVNIGLSFGFSAAIPPFGEFLLDRNAKPDSKVKAQSIMTAVVDSTGAVTRTLRANEKLRFTFSELQELAGQPDWLDSIVESVGPNKLLGAPLQQGASARLTGGQLKIHISCSDELDFDLGDISWDEDYVCSISASIYDAAFQSAQRTEMSGDSVLEHTFYGIEIVVTTRGSLHAADPNALLYFLVSSAVLLAIPGSIIVCCALTCCGRVSRVYYHASYNQCSLCNIVSAKTVNMMSYVHHFKELDDRTPDVAYMDETKIQGGVSVEAVHALMEQFVLLHGSAHEQELAYCIHACFDLILEFQDEERLASQNGLQRSHSTSSITSRNSDRSVYTAGSYVNLQGHLHFSSDTERFTIRNLLGMFQSSYRKGCLELFFTPSDYHPSYWRELVKKAKRKRPMIEGAMYDEDVVRMLGKTPGRQLHSNARSRQSKEDLLELHLEETSKENKRMQHKMDRYAQSLEACFGLVKDFHKSFDVVERSLSEERKQRKAKRRRRRKEKARKRAERQQQLSAASPGSFPARGNTLDSAGSISSRCSSQLEDTVTMASEMRVKMKTQLANIGDRLSRLEPRFPVKRKNSRPNAKYGERLPLVSNDVQHENEDSESWSASIYRYVGESWV